MEACVYCFFFFVCGCGILQSISHFFFCMTGWRIRGGYWGKEGVTHALLALDGTTDIVRWWIVWYCVFFLLVCCWVVCWGHLTVSRCLSALVQMGGGVESVEFRGEKMAFFAQRFGVLCSTVLCCAMLLCLLCCV